MPLPAQQDNVPPRLATAQTWLYRAALILLFAWFTAMALHGLANVWQWGHNGYNGAAFTQAARNSLRFHIFGQALYYTGLEPPKPEAIYTHHPMMLHFHLIAAQGLLGTREWVGRLIPAVYSVLDLAMIVVIARHTAGRAVALAAGVVYALTPLNLIFANMIDHEQACIFWTLVMLYGYLRWLEGGGWRWLSVCLVAVTIAVQWDWAAYYFAFFIAVHALGLGVHAGLARDPAEGWRRWRPTLVFLAIFSAVVLLNAAGFFLWIKSLRGGLTEMGSAFAGRSSSPDAYFDRLWKRSLDLQGPLLLGLLAAWLPLELWRLVSRRANFYDFVAIAFFLAQTVHSLVFKQAGYIHCYWTFYLGPALALGGGLLVVTAVRALAGLLARVVPGQESLLRVAIGVLVAVVLVPMQAREALAKLRWGFSTGSASYVVPYNSQLDEIAFAKAVAARYPRARVKYLIHGSIQSRIEIEWYLDAPIESRGDLLVQPQDTQPKPKEAKQAVVLLVDLAHTGDRARLRELAEQHATWVYDRRFFAIELRAPARPMVSLQAVPQEPSVAWSWFVHPDRPPTLWMPAQPSETPAILLDPPVEVTATLQAGGGGGGAADWNCGVGQVLVGLTTRDTVWADKHRMVGLLVPYCQDLRVEAPRHADATTRRLVTQGPIWEGPKFGDQGSEGRQTLLCRDGDVPVGIWGRAGALVDAVGLLCASGAELTRDRLGRQALNVPEVHKSRLVGGPGGDLFERRCPPDSVMWGLRSHVGMIVDNVGIACAVLTPAFLAGREVASPTVRVVPAATVLPAPATPAAPVRIR